METKVLALGESWFHYAARLGRDGEVITNEPHGVGGIIYHLTTMYGLTIYYDETTTGDIYDAQAHTVKSVDDALGCCGEEILVMTHGGGNSWLDLLVQRIGRYAAANNKFIILLSAGGNDIVDRYLINY